MASGGSSLSLMLLISAQDQASKVISAIGSSFGPVGVAIAGVSVAAIGAAAEAVKMAGDFQQSTTTLVTSAGESAASLGMVRQGILDMSVATGTSTQQLVDGMYMIESAGYHGAAGLQVLQAAAQGAKAENASLGTVANAVTTVLTDYHMSAGQAANAMNALVATVASGKTHLQDLSASMGAVLPLASALGISFPQVAGAIATMTNSGMSAQQAAQNLAFAIRGLSTPNGAAIKSMHAVGLSAQELKDTLVNKGLPAAIQLIEDHVGKKFPAGSVEAVTAFKKIMGGAVGFNVALMLGGKNMQGYQDRIKSIAAALNSSSKEVLGWSEIQGNLNFKLDQAKMALDMLMIVIGTALLPVLGQALDVMTSIVLALTNLVSSGGPVLTFLRSASSEADLVRVVLQGLGIGIALFLSTYIPGLIAGFYGYALAAWDAAAAVITATWPFILIGIAIAGVILLFRKLYDSWSGFRMVVNAVSAALQNFWHMLVHGVGTALQLMWEWVQLYIIPALQLFWQWLTGNIMSALRMVGTWIMNNVVPALQTFWHWLQNKIVAAFQTFTDWVQSKVVPALQTLWQWLTTRIVGAFQLVYRWIMNNLVPALQTLWGWLQNQLLPALQAVADWIQNKVIPALQAFYTQIQNRVVSALQSMWDWIQNKIGQALANLATWIQGTVIPQLQSLWQWIQNKVVPAMQTWWTWLTTNIAKALTNLSNQIQTVVIPQLQIFWQSIENKIIPVLQTWDRQMQTTANKGMKTLADQINHTVIPALQTMWDWLMNKVITALSRWDDALKTAGKSITDWAQKTQDGQNALIAVRDAAKTVTDFFKATLQPALKTLKDTFDTQLVPAIYDFKYAFDQLNTTLQVIANMLQGNFNLQLTNTDKAIKPVQTDTQLLSQILQATFVTALSVVTGALGGIIQGFANFLFGLNQVLSGIAQIFRGTREIIQGTMSLIADIIQGKWDQILLDFDMMGRGIYDITMGTWQSILGVFNMSMSFITGLVSGFVTIIEQYFTNLSNDLVGHSIIPDMCRAIILWFTNLWTTVTTGVTTFVANFLARVVAFWLQVQAYWKVYTSAIIVIVQTWLANMITNVQTGWNNIVSTITSFAGKLINAIETPFQTAVNFVKGLFTGLQSTVSGIISGILANIASIHMPTLGASGGGGNTPAGNAPPFVPGHANGVYNFTGGLAYVHQGEVLANLAPGTSVIPSRNVNIGGSGGTSIIVNVSGSRTRNEAQQIATEVDKVLARRYRSQLGTISTGGTSI